MPAHGTEAIKKYYSDTQFEYGLIWNWRSKNTPALHFGYYDEKATNHHRSVIRANEVLAEWGNIPHGAGIIDAGCGLGHSTLWLAEHYNARVTGITLVPKQVETMQKFIAKKGIKNVAFLEANYFNMPFEDNSVDIVWAIEAVCHAQDKSQFYKEAYRVLKPGGKLLIGENLRTARPLAQEKEELLKEIFNSWAIPDLDTLEEHRSHALSSGFRSFESKDVTANMMVSYRNLEEMCKRWAWLNKLLHAVGIISTVRRDNMLGSLKQYMAIRQKVFTYNHLLAQK
ncbi:MAG: Methyltransferase type 11 [Chitinophagaceae bacterium]|nr:Methyltransferase type 11 [Chitinophagaceae bacterium]MDB5221905.1 Methyltransferase type 11 [Chitinophagaceae bacterium]